MTKFQYTGPSQNMGHFGFLNTNDFVWADNDVLKNLANDNRFVQVTAAEDAREVEIAFDVISVPVAGDGLQAIQLPFDLYLTAIIATLDQAHPSIGLTLDVNKNGTSILSTKLSLDANELSSASAAVPAVISDGVLPAGSLVTLDIDAAPPLNGSVVAGGLRVFLQGTSANARIRYSRELSNPSSVGAKLINDASALP